METLYKFSGKPFIKLNRLQTETLSKFNDQIGKKLIYVKNDCICNKDQSILISETCRYGLNVNFKLCKYCGIVRQDPILSESSLQIFYKDFYRTLYTGENSEENVKKIFNAQVDSGKKYYEVLELILEKNNKKISNYKNVLEIGSSAGGILSYFLSKGHNVHAMDYDERYLNYAYQSGIKNIYNNLEKINTKFDLIILAHTFEHFKDLNKNINLICNLLKENGLVFFDIPGIFNKEYYHIRNIIYDIQRTHFLYYLQNAHTYYFTSETFNNFIKNLKMFNIIHVDEKINCLIEKTKKNNEFTVNKFHYKKITHFIKMNNIRYKILCFVKIVFYPLLRLIKKLKTS